MIVHLHGLRRARNVLPELEEWCKKHFAPPPLPPPLPKQPRIKTPASPLERAALVAIASIHFPPATSAKRFARDMRDATELTPGQREFLWLIVHRFRRQLSNPEVLAEAKRRKEAQTWPK